MWVLKSHENLQHGRVRAHLLEPVARRPSDRLTLIVLYSLRFFHVFFFLLLVNKQFEYFFCSSAFLRVARKF